MKRILSLIFAVLMLVSVLPVAVLAQDSYTVILHAGPEGQGNSVTLTKKAGEPLSLAHLRADITASYGIEPKGGNSDQRAFIMWADGYNATTARGTGNTYFESFDEDRDVELYAIWGYPVMYNADGGRFADGSTKKLDYVANYAEWNGESTDPKSMYRYSMPDWNGDVPVKEGARRRGNGAGPDGKGYAYGLIREDGKTFFTWEGYGENLTIPPVGGAYYPSGNHNGATWAMFNCIPADDTSNPYNAPIIEFIAIWEPSVTYDPNGGNGDSYSEYMTWDWSIAKYENYTIDNNSFTNSGARFTGWNTMPDGSGRAYPAGRRITNTPGKDSNPFTLYAQWEYDHEHSYSSVTTDPTCVEEGKTVYTCTACPHSYEETIPATGEHSYDSVTVEPTCSAEGNTVYTCTVCSRSYEETIPATGEHSYIYTTTEPTCGEGGVKVNTCIKCFDSYIETLPATGEHNYGEWGVAVAPTYFDEGLEERVCTVCQNKEERSVPVKEYVNVFTDVKDTHWFCDEVAYCVKRGYVSGMTETTFVPSGNLTRAQFLTLLAKLDGADLDAYNGKNAGFEDVKSSHWFNEEVCWAVENGITSGLSETKFGPGNNVTRAQVARFFYVYSEQKDIAIDTRADLSVFPDADKLQDWAKTPVEWAVGIGIINGVKKNDTNFLDPNGTATRAQAAVMFKAYDDFRGINN